MSELQIGPVENGVMLVELDRPPGNLLTVELCQQLTAVLLQQPPGAHVLRLRAHGEAFCLGRERAGSTPGELRAETEVLVALHRALRATPLVTVAEVSGDAAGFGVGLLAACDVAIALESAQLSFPEVGIGLAPALVLAWLPRVVGDREAFWLTATGEPVAGARAVELGLVNAVVATREQLVAAVDDRVGQLRTRKPRLHSEIRSLLAVNRSLSEDQALEMSIDRLVVGGLRRGDAD